MIRFTSQQNSDGAFGTRLAKLTRLLRFAEVKISTGGQVNSLRVKLAFTLALPLLLSGLLVPSARADLFAVDSGRALYVIDITTGAKTQIGTVSANAGTTAGLAYDRANNIVYLTSTSNDSVYTLNLATGAATLIGNYADAAIVMHGLEYDDSTGILYGVSSHNNGLYSINTTTGFATLIGTSGLTSFTNLGYNPITNEMFATNSGADSFYSINRATGATTLIGPLNGPTNPNGLAFNPDNQILYLVDNTTDNLYSINTATGAATIIGSTSPGNLLGLVYVIPEPTSLLLLGLGAGLFAVRRWGGLGRTKRKI